MTMSKKRNFTTRSITVGVEGKESEGQRIISGFIPYNQRSEFMGFYEYITNTAFNKTLADGADVRALLDHDTSKLIGRISNGSLKLESREDGLYAECILPDTQYARDAYDLISKGYNNGLSFGFTIINEDYGYEDGIEVHYLREVRLYEISWAVAFPAYESTQASIVRGINLNDLSRSLGKENLTEEDINNVKDTIEELKKLIPEEEEKEEEERSNTAADTNITPDVDEDLEFLEKTLKELHKLLGE